ncbi:MAG: DNA-3-methyladenine glycosylase 2 family protein [Clostridiales bacterium]|nr:DNA-3-methyladenine glycosylase 2 family protein [Clostridiales bacterium]
MITITDPDFDIRKIADSGQCFRLNRDEDGGYTLVAWGRMLRLFDMSDGCALDCSQADFDAVWRNYFDLDRDYAAIRSEIDPGDAFLKSACDYGRGIRMLRQDPFETLVSFIVSQRKNIPAIKRCVEALCARYGEPLGGGDAGVFAFPTAERLAAQDEAGFLACSLGYRAKYVLAAARMAASGALDLDGIGGLDDGALLNALLTVPGVGEKVANCVMLFGYHRLGRFPRDVWINRVEEREYGGAFPLERYPDTAGVLQQYVFYYARSAQYA